MPRAKRSGAKKPGRAGANSLRTLLADIVESSSDAIFSRSLDGSITSWNAGAARMFGFRPSEIIGDSGLLLLPEDRVHEQTEFFEKIKQGHRIEDFETIRLRRNGEAIAVSLTVSPIRDEKRRIIGASTIARDISVQRRLESELLKISDRERSRIGRDLHDGLGQQLTGMELVCRTLVDSLSRKNIREAETARLLLREIRKAVEQTRALARGLTLVLESPNGLLIALQDLCKQISQIAKVRCSFQCAGIPAVTNHSAAIHLYRIAQEAASNAIRHGECKRLTIKLSRVKQGLKLAISDNGRGFAPNGSRSRGLGLHLMQYRATMMRGSLRVEKRRGKGTRVTCLVPLERVEV